MRPEELDRSSAEALHCAAIVGDILLALELVRLGIVEQEEALEEAKALRPLILAAVDEAKR